MKKRVIWARAAFAVLSCTAVKEEEPAALQQQEETAEGEPGAVKEGFKTLSIKASHVPGVESKTSYAGEVTFSWSNGDKISVLCNDGEHNFWQTFTAQTAAKSSNFSATVPSNVVMGPMDGTSKVAMFPACDDHVYNGPWSLKYHIPAERDFRAASGAHASADVPMFAWGTADDNYSFSNLTGAAKFSFSGLTFSTAKMVFTASGVKLNGTFSLLYDSIDTANSSNVHWNVANAADDSEKTVTYYGDVVDGTVSFYLPYGEGTIWGNSTLRLMNAETDEVWYNNTHVGSIPVEKNRITVLPTLCLGFESQFGIDWSGISAAENTTNSYPAIRKMKATGDANYLYLYLEVDPSVLEKSHTYDHYISIYAADTGGSAKYWGSNPVTLVSSPAWAVDNGDITFKNWKAPYTPNLLTTPDTWYYEVRIERNVHSILSAGGTVSIGVELDDVYYDGTNYARLNGYVPYGVTPTYGEDLYPVELPTTLNYSFTEAEGEIVNPERGLYVHTEYKFDGSLPQTKNLSAYQNNSLAMLLFYLKDFMEEDHLSEDAVTRIREVFETVRQAGKKAVVRFAYTWEHHETIDEQEVEIHPHEATPTRIANHMDDVAQILTDYADIIYVVQAGWVGTYGEWYYVEDPFKFTLSGDAVTGFGNRKDVMDKLLSVVPEPIQVAMRSAFYKRYYLSPESVGSWTHITSWGTSPNQRLSLFNDGFRGSANDVGTFLSQTDWDMWYSQGNWLACGGELSYRDQETFDGLSADLKDVDESVAELRRQHLSYLHDSDSNRFMKKWKDEGRLDDIKKALGYRLVLGDVSFEIPELSSGTPVNYSIQLKNTGCAPVIYPRPFKLVLVNGDTCTELKDLGDIRSITPGDEFTTLSGSFALPVSIGSGDKLAIWLPDRTESLRGTASYSIRLANDGINWSNGYNVLHTF